MKSLIRILISIALCIGLAAMWGQTGGGDAAREQLTIAHSKQALRTNRAQLVKYQRLPVGTDYLDKTAVNARSKQIQVTPANSHYTPVGP